MRRSDGDVFPELESSDDDDENFETIVSATVQQQQKSRPIAAQQLSPDDRPITPMKNTMIYNTEFSSLGFKDGTFISGIVGIAFGCSRGFSSTASWH